MLALESVELHVSTTCSRVTENCSNTSVNCHAVFQVLEAEKGKALFSKNACFQCHNNEAQGGAAGPRLGPDPIPFQRFVAYVRAPREEMPPYTVRVMSDQELADVYAFVEARPRPPAVGNVPLLLSEVKIGRAHV